MSLNKLRVPGLLFAAGSLALASQAEGAFPFVQDMENDTDAPAYNPSLNPLTDPPTGTPPRDGDSPTSTYFDTRTGGSGVIEEVPNNYVAGVSAPDGSAHYAVVQFDRPAAGEGDGPFGWPAFSYSNPGPSSARMDVYLDPALPHVPNGSPSYWWSNAVSDATTPTYYLTEGSYQVTKNADGSYDITNGTTTIVDDLASGQWVTLEMVPFEGVDNNVWFQFNVYDAETLEGLGSVSALSYNTVPYSSLGGPSYTWFNKSNAGLDDPIILIDNIGWSTPIPEPASLALLASGGLLALSRRKRI